MPDVEALTITSNPQERRLALSSCVQRLIAQGLDPDQAQMACLDAADKAMGTRELQLKQMEARRGNA